MPDDPQPNWLQQLVAREIIQSYKSAVDDRNHLATQADQLLQDKAALENSLADSQMALTAAQSTIEALRAASAQNQPILAALTRPTSDLETRAWQVLVLYGFSAFSIRAIYGSGIGFSQVSGPRSAYFGGPPPHIEMLTNQVDSNPFWLHELTHAAVNLSPLGLGWEDAFYEAYRQCVLAGDPADEGVRAARAYFYGIGNVDPEDRKQHAFVYTIQHLMGRYKALPVSLWPFYAPFFTGEPLVSESWDL